MIFNRGDVYINTHSGIKCLIEWVKDDKVKILWSFKCKLGGSKNWPRNMQYFNESVVDGPDGYIEYACINHLHHIELEISGGYIKRIHEAKDNLIMFWIPQHSFLAL
jgi:hypothetical protein